MATEQASSVTTETGSYAKYLAWLGALVGLWVAASPFVLSGPIAEGTPLYSNFVAGLAALALGAATAFSIRSRAEQPAFSVPEIAGWVVAVVGLWILVAPFVLGGAVAKGAAMYGNVVAGIVVLALGAYVGYWDHAEG